MDTCPNCGSARVEVDQFMDGWADCLDCGYAFHESEAEDA